MLRRVSPRTLLLASVLVLAMALTVAAGPAGMPPGEPALDEASQPPGPPPGPPPGMGPGMGPGDMRPGMPPMHRMGMPFMGMPPMMMPPRGLAKSGPAAGPLALFVLADKLKLTDEQLISLRHIFKKYRDGMADLKKRQNKAQKEFRKLMASDQEEPGLAGLPTTLGKLAEERATIMVTALVEARKVLDADQLKAVKKICRKFLGAANRKPVQMGPRGPARLGRPGPFGARPSRMRQRKGPDGKKLPSTWRAREAWDKIRAPKDEEAPPPPPPPTPTED